MRRTGLGTAATARRPPLRTLGVATLVGAAAAGAAVAGSVGFVRLLSAGRIYPEADAPHAPVALVFGAQVYPDGTPSPFLAGRLDLAKRLYDRGTVRVILVSGDNMAKEYNEPDAMRDYLVAAGIPPEHVVADYAGFDTYDSAARASRVFGVRRLIAVTQDYHLPRAVATCRALGIDAVGVGDERRAPRSRAWWRGAVRDQVACVKTVLDLLQRRDPVLGPKETDIERLLLDP